MRQFIPNTPEHWQIVKDTFVMAVLMSLIFLSQYL